MQGLVFLIDLGHMDSVPPPSQPGDSRISCRCVTEIFGAAEEGDISLDNPKLRTYREPHDARRSANDLRPIMELKWRCRSNEKINDDVHCHVGSVCAQGSERGHSAPEAGDDL